MYTPATATGTCGDLSASLIGEVATTPHLAKSLLVTTVTRPAQMLGAQPVSVYTKFISPTFQLYNILICLTLALRVGYSCTGSGN